MRKRTPLVLFAAAFLLAASASPLLAQRRSDRSPLQLYVDIGYVNLFDYPKWINVGPELELRLGPLSINPDVALWIGQNFSRKVKVVPGLTANLRLRRRFLVGGGVAYRISDWPEDPLAAETGHNRFMPKAQIGYLLGPARLTFALLFPGGADSVAAGLTIGMRLGRPSRD